MKKKEFDFVGNAARMYADHSLGCGKHGRSGGRAKRSGSITFPGYAPPELIKKFQQETGITVEVTDSSNEDMIAKLRATPGRWFRSRPAEPGRFVAVTQQFGLYQPIDLSKVNTDQIDPVLLASVKKNASIGDKLYAIPHVFGSSRLVGKIENGPRREGLDRFPESKIQRPGLLPDEAADPLCRRLWPRRESFRQV